MQFRGLKSVAVAAMLISIATVANADDSLKLAVGQRGNWDTSVSEIGQRLGIFKKHGLTLELLYTQGGGETQQAVLSGSVDIGVAAGIMGVLGAFAKGAPVRILGAETTGAADLFWYVRADSPIKSLKDTAGKTISYSNNGSSTHGIVVAFMKQEALSAKPVSTGGPPGTLTQVMSGQIDVGWSAPPFALDQLDRARFASLRPAMMRKPSRGRPSACWSPTCRRWRAEGRSSIGSWRPIGKRSKSCTATSLWLLRHMPTGLE